MRSAYLKIALAKIAIVFSCVIAFAGTSEVVTIKPYGQDDQRYRYAQILLEMSLEKAGQTARVRQMDTELSRDRLLPELIDGEIIHVVAEAPKPGWEENLLTIRIPIRKGIQGHRLFLINKRDQPAISQVETLEDLLAFPTGSGAQWSTRRVMENAGFQVVTAPEYKTLFDMLKLGRFTTFSRGLNEIFQEQAIFSKTNPNLIVEESLCLFIPLPTYFFVSPKHPELARQIETGLRQMISDGSFDKHFLDFHGDDIARAKLEGRKIFSIANPNLSPLTPLDDKSLWLDPRNLRGNASDSDS